MDTLKTKIAKMSQEERLKLIRELARRKAIRARLMKKIPKKGEQTDES
ncbi:hypothetical protein KKC91_09360 [bacterium]|nr:hypothetical protein [bacterium]